MLASNGTDHKGPRIVLYLEYEGTRYQGFQLQRGGPTVQGALEDALEHLIGERLRIAAASRTDAGVHAQGQVVSFPARVELPLQAYVGGLNHHLPHDIAVTAAYWAPPGLDVRRHALSRVYRYSILNRRTRSPLRHRWTAQVREPLDVGKMREAADALHGWLDVRPFTGPLPPHRTPRRRLDRAEVRRDGDLVILELEGNSFLPHQVRRTAGALVDVGRGRTPPEEFQRLTREGTPGEAAWTMPAQGLCLMGVRYDDFPPMSEGARC